MSKPYKQNKVVGKFWELQGFYSTGRRYLRQGRLRALWSTLLHGWHD
jgi:hypothetical protein